MILGRFASTAVFAILLAATPTLSQTVTGKATYYNPAGGTGSCGTVIQNSDMEAALGYNEFGGGENPNAAPICNGGAGTPYTVTAPNGKSITVRILDKCQACDNDPPHIDLTAGAFQALGYDLGQGVIQGVVYGPADGSSSGGSSGCQPYTVKSGDTCYAIWTSHGQNEAQFDALNPGIDCSDLQIGQQICA